MRAYKVHHIISNARRTKQRKCFFKAMKERVDAGFTELENCPNGMLRATVPSSLSLQLNAASGEVEIHIMAELCQGVLWIDLECRLNGP